MMDTRNIRHTQNGKCSIRKMGGSEWTEFSKTVNVIKTNKDYGNIPVREIKINVKPNKLEY